MSAYEFIQKTIQDRWNERREQARWMYHGQSCDQGGDQGVDHRVGLLDHHEVVTCSMAYGWIGSCEEFVKDFRLAS